MAKSHHDTSSSGATEPTSSPSLQRYYQERLENARRHLPEAARQLKAAGVFRVHIQYDGCRDSGEIESVSYFDKNQKPVNPKRRITMTEDQLIDLFYDLTQVRHPSWEDNDGAFGEFEWDLAADTLHHTHNDRFTDHDTTEHDGL